ncbi:unnamed protein product, partial [Didymodactylos carnosus]
QAKKWIDQGYQTLDDLRAKAHLTHNQQVGLKYYDEFLQRIPRAEIQEIEHVVRETAELLRPGIILTTGGSYRRGQQTCGDCDMIITHPDGKSHENLLIPLVESLKKKAQQQSYITDDLVYTDRTDAEGTHIKYYGVFILPGEGRVHRRLDIIIVPYSEHGCALIYFTGSTLFNRSMRRLADDMNMHLSGHRLQAGVIRKGKKLVNEGVTLPTPTEESVFKYLNLPYRPPTERDH